MAQTRIILVTFPAQGCINPALQFAKSLISVGVDVNFFTTLSTHRRMINTGTSTPDGLSFIPFSDGYDDGFKPGDDTNRFVSELGRRGSQALSNLIISNENQGRPFSYIVYTLLLPWVVKVAHELHVPSALLWVEPATVFDIYYYYFHGYGDLIRDKMSKNDDPSCSIRLPGLPLELTSRDVPSILDAENANNFAAPLYKQLFQMLDKESNPKVLVNTFESLEPEALRSISKLDMIGIGPLILSAFLDYGKEKDPSDTSFGGDLFQQSSKDYKQWLNSKPKRSVIYVSFGSISVLSKPQMVEIGRALLDYGRPFLWVVTEKQRNAEKKEEEEDHELREELEKLGKIVQWCSQMEVLSNPSLGCCVTHCGWNSTLESLVCGVPMVPFPQWIDQRTNAKLIEDVWKTGLKVKANKEGIVERDEIKRCLELVMGDGEIGEEIRRNAKKWKDLGREAAMDGGSSYRNFKAFVSEL